MPRPKTKAELIEISNIKFSALFTLIESYSKEEQAQNFTPEKLYKNLRDIIAHLHHWNTLMINWYKVGMGGNKPIMPAEGYTWKTLPAYNKMIWESYLDKSLDNVLPLFKESFRNVMTIIEKHSNDELFEKKKYGWTGSTSLGSYLNSCTVSHYDWAIKRIKKSMKK